MKTIGLFAVDCLNYELINRAIKLSSKDFQFDQILLLSDKKIDESVPTKIIPKINSLLDYSNFIVKNLHNYVETDYALIIQWDGYIVNPQCWLDRFLNYDYIGAVWPLVGSEFNVGNGGFSLRSKYLLETVAQLSDSLIKENEDVYICQTLRKALEEVHEISFAPESVANLFSYERVNPQTYTFGFHGFFNMWRHTSAEDIDSILNLVDKNFLHRQEFIELMTIYFSNGEYLLFKKMFNLILSQIKLDNMFDLLKSHNIDPQLARHLIYSGKNI